MSVNAFQKLKNALSDSFVQSKALADIQKLNDFESPF